MSTHWGYVCMGHNPPLESEHWFNHGEERLLSLLSRREHVVAWTEDAVERHYDDYDYPAVCWLRKHPTCPVILQNEYGDRIVPGDLHCPSCTCVTHPRAERAS